MDTRTLHNFLVLAEQLHFGRASELCHLSPSALSRNLKQLEQELGTTLFDRDNRTVNLTSQGVKFQQYARDALSQWEIIKSSLQADAEHLRGQIRLFSSVTASYSLLHDLLNRFRNQHSAIEIKLHTGDPEHAISRILSGDDDLTIAARPDKMPPNLAFKALTTSPLLFINAADQPEFIPPSQIEDWGSVPMILSEEGVSRKRVDQWFKQHHIKPQIYSQVAGNEAIVSMVSLGFGIGVVPKIVLDNSPLANKINVLENAPKLKPYEVGLCTLNKKLRNPLINAFWSVC